MPAMPLLSVTTVQIAVMSSDPPGLSITVQGHAGTPGWTDVQLVPDAGEPSADGILDLAPSGTPPTGIVPQVPTPGARRSSGRTR